MEDLPKLVKPYYSINDTFNRLKVAGAYLDEVEDIFLLIRNKMLRASLLLDKQTTLIKTDFARPYQFEESLGFEPGQENIDFFISSLNHTEEQAKSAIHAINYARWMIPDFLRAEDISMSTDSKELEDSRMKLLQTSLDCVEQAIKTDAVVEVSPDNPIAVTPMIIRREVDNKNSIKGIFEYDFTRSTSIYDFSEQAAVTWNGQGYFVCKRLESFFTELADIVIEIGDNFRFRPVDVLDTNLIPSMIKSKNFVITKGAIEQFEQEYLEIEHGVATQEHIPDYLNKKSPYYAEELDIAIQAHTAVFKEKFGNPYQSNTDRINGWLIKNYPEKSQSDLFLKRIRTVVLPKK